MADTGRLAVFTGLPASRSNCVSTRCRRSSPARSFSRTTAASICGTDLHVWRGDLGRRLRTGGTGAIAASRPWPRNGGPGASGLGKGSPPTRSRPAPTRGRPGDIRLLLPMPPVPRTCASGDLYACPNTGYSTAVPLGEAPLLHRSLRGLPLSLAGAHRHSRSLTSISDDLAAAVNCAFGQVAVRVAEDAGGHLRRAGRHSRAPEASASMPQPSQENVAPPASSWSTASRPVWSWPGAWEPARPST